MGRKSKTGPEGEEWFLAWLRLGMRNGWIGPPVCDTRDGTPTSEEEDESEWDCCIHVVRLYTDIDHKAAVEENHIMTQERKREFGGE